VDNGRSCFRDRGGPAAPPSSGPLRIFEKFVVRASTQERNIVFDALKASFEK